MSEGRTEILVDLSTYLMQDATFKKARTMGRRQSSWDELQPNKDICKFPSPPQDSRTARRQGKRDSRQRWAMSGTSEPGWGAIKTRDLYWPALPSSLVHCQHTKCRIRGSHTNLLNTWCVRNGLVLLNEDPRIPLLSSPMLSATNSYKRDRGIWRTGARLEASRLDQKTNVSRHSCKNQTN